MADGQFVQVKTKPRTDLIELAKRSKEIIQSQRQQQVEAFTTAEQNRTNIEAQRKQFGYPLSLRFGRQLPFEGQERKGGFNVPGSGFLPILTEGIEPFTQVARVVGGTFLGTKEESERIREAVLTGQPEEAREIAGGVHERLPLAGQIAVDIGFDPITWIEGFGFAQASAKLLLKLLGRGGLKEIAKRGPKVAKGIFEEILTSPEEIIAKARKIPDLLKRRAPIRPPHHELPPYQQYLGDFNELVARNAPDHEFRALFSTGARSVLKKGETWKSKYSEYLNYQKGRLAQARELWKSGKSTEYSKWFEYEEAVQGTKGALQEGALTFGRGPEVLPPSVEAPGQPWMMARDKLVTLIQAAKPARRTTEQLKRIELARKSAAIRGVLKDSTGFKAYKQSLAQLRGRLPKAQFEAPEVGMTADDVNALFAKIQKSPLREFETVNYGQALEKSLLGEIPTKGEIAKLEQIFGGELAKALLSKRPISARAKDVAWNVLGMPRSILSSMDLSAPLRQGAVLSWGQPKQFWGNFKNMIKAFASEGAAERIDDSIRLHRNFEVSKALGLYTAPWRKATAGTFEMEEAFQTAWAAKIPGLRHSERAFVTFLNKIRHDVFNNYYDMWRAAGASSARLERDGKELAKVLNWFTGRGPSLGPQEWGPALNQVFYSTRLQTARIATPTALLSPSPEVRKFAARQLVSFVGVNSAILWMLNETGAADVELDPRSSDFGKIRLGPTRLDPWGGFQSLARYIAQMSTEQRKTTGAGKIVDVPRDNSFFRLLQSKLAPVAGFTLDWMRGEDFIGDEMALDKASVMHQARNRLTPMFIQDVWEATEEAGMSGAFYSIPGAFGYGIQSFKNLTDIEREITVDMFPEKDVESLSVGERRQVRQDERYKTAVAALEGKGLPSTSDQVSTLLNRYGERKVELESDLLGEVGMAQTTIAKREAVQRFKSKRYEASQTLMTEDVQEYMKRDNELTKDVLASQYWSADAPIDNETGLPNFDIRDEARQKILAQASSVSIDPNYISGKGEGTFRGERFEDPEVRVIINQYESVQETLRAYWDAGKDGVEEDWTEKKKEAFISIARKRLRKENWRIDLYLLQWYGDTYTKAYTDVGKQWLREHGS